MRFGVGVKTFLLQQLALGLPSPNWLRESLKQGYLFGSCSSCIDSVNNQNRTHKEITLLWPQDSIVG